MEMRSGKGFRIYVFVGSVLLFLLIHELLLSLMGFQFFAEDFLVRLIYGFFMFWALFRLNKNVSAKLDEQFPWSRNPVKRFGVQTLQQAVLNNLILHLGLLGLEYFAYRAGFANVFVDFTMVFYQFLIVALVLELNVLVDFSGYFVQQWHHARVQQESYEKDKARFNLEMLRNQINPHFLFNNLNTLSSLIYESQDKAADFLRMLSRVYRSILEFRNRETIPLSEELDFFDNYRKLLSIRFEGMLFFELNVPDSIRQKQVIPLCLQMLIENAIKHNVVSASRPLRVEIFYDAGKLVVRNNLQAKENLEFSSKLGLEMISNRFDFMGGGKVEIEKTDSFFTVQIPLLPENLNQAQ
ncbi:MAG: histidine kinase [Bacteroidia bacterium]|nr:histidine kinase [Bacteroidia bacterium]